MKGIRLRRLAVATVVASVVLVSATSAEPSAAATFSPCKGGLVANAGEPPSAPLEPYRWKIRARGIGCGAAMRVARRYLERHADGAWTCGSTHFEAGCSRGRAAVVLRAVHPVGRSCGKLGFEPNTENGASEIRAQRVDCGTARRLVRAAYEGTDRLGFECHSRYYEPLGLPYTHWVCERQGQRVRWIKT